MIDTVRQHDKFHDHYLKGELAKHKNGDIYMVLGEAHLKVDTQGVLNSPSFTTYVLYTLYAEDNMKPKFKNPNSQFKDVVWAREKTEMTDRFKIVGFDEFSQKEAEEMLAKRLSSTSNNTLTVPILFEATLQKGKAYKKMADATWKLEQGV